MNSPPCRRVEDASDHGRKRWLGRAGTIEVAAQLEKSMKGTLCGSRSAKIISRAMNLRDLERVEMTQGEASESFSHQISFRAKVAGGPFGRRERRHRNGYGRSGGKDHEAARERRMDAVVGRHDRGRLAGLLLGSVSQKLVSLPLCCVIGFRASFTMSWLLLQRVIIMRASHKPARCTSGAGGRSNRR